MRASIPALRLENLSKSFGRIRAVDQLSLNVHPGEMVGFLGPNGAGKSTTLYMVAGLVHPSGGRIEIFGRDHQTHFRQTMESVGFLLERSAFYEDLTGLTNLRLAARLRKSVRPSHPRELLHQMGLWDRRNDKVRTYSQGMKQRLGLAVALLGQPRMLVLDEPTNGMDPEATRDVLSMLRERAHTHSLAVFLSSHLLYEVEEFCDRVVIINKGRAIASGEVKDLLAPQDNVVQVTFAQQLPASDGFGDEPSIESVAEISAGTLEFRLSDRRADWLTEFLVGRGYRVSAVAPKRRTLKDLFLSLTGDELDANDDTDRSA